jgi:hypothetical protein
MIANDIRIVLAGLSECQLEKLIQQDFEFIDASNRKIGSCCHLQFNRSAAQDGSPRAAQLNAKISSA